MIRKTNFHVANVIIYGDWDADGFVSTALIAYSQEKLCKYPLNNTAIVNKKPIEPDKLRYIISDLNKPIDLLILLDIPYTNSIVKILNIVKTHFSVQKIMYIDHHMSTFNNRELLEKTVDLLIIDTSKPTSRIIYDILQEKGVSVHTRLKTFVELVYYMDTGRRIPVNLLKLFELVKMFSKALNITRDPALWIKIVDWLIEPVATSDTSFVESIRRIVDKYEKTINELALDLAISSVKIGDFKFIDARNKWKYRGASALASKLSNILKSPVILWVDTSKEYTLLIIKATSSKAYRLSEYLLKEKLAIDIAGHPNLSIVKIPRRVDREKLVEYLHKAIYYL